MSLMKISAADCGEFCAVSESTVLLNDGGWESGRPKYGCGPE